MATGTPKSINISGIRLFPDRDCNAKLPGGVYEVEALPHAGGSQKKLMRSSGGITGFTFKASKLEHEKLQELNDDPNENLSLSYTDASRNIFRAIGFIKYDGLDDADNRGTVDMIPVDGFWTLFSP